MVCPQKEACDQELRILLLFGSDKFYCFIVQFKESPYIKFILSLTRPLVTSCGQGKRTKITVKARMTVSWMV